MGIDAVPELLRHLDDERTINMEPMAGMMWMDFADEYDFNRRTRSDVPQGVNREAFADQQDHPDQHALTVGDLCFVALGQIVNRNFSATRYQPTGGLVVSSPTYSQALRERIIADWTGLTEDEHRQMLVDDFTTPDHEYRRIGAYLRLSFYYPDTVEPLVLSELAKPTYDVFAIEKLCRDTLYKLEAEDERQAAYDDFIREHGEAHAAGVMDQLFDDLNRLEGHERGAISPPLTRFGTQPRELLIQLFGMPEDVKSTDRPFVEPASTSERARLIEALTRDDSQEIGDVVRQQFLDSAEDAYFAPACLRCLASRGYSDFLVEQLDKIDVTDSEANPLHWKYMESISTSEDEIVREKLREILTTTTNDAYFMAALPAIADSDSERVFELACEILSGLPDDTEQGRSLLEMIGERYPDRARSVYEAFLEPGSARRAETMCRILWNGHELSIELLAPMLDDKRPLTGFSIPMRVCDRAAQAISHTTEEIRFDSEWSTARKDEQIEKLKAYCERESR